MATSTYSNFKGLKVQQNSFSNDVTSMEEAENISLVYDNLITKRRGFTEDRKFEDGQEINNIFQYQDDLFAVSQDKLYRMPIPLTTAQAATLSGSATITVTKNNHGLTTNDYITYFNVEDTDDFINAFDSRQAAYYGTHQITVTSANTFTFQASEVALATTVSGATAASYKYYYRVGGQPVVVSSLTGVAQNIEANKNAYFLSDNGLMKLERDDLPLLKAGIPQAMDISVVLGKQGSSTPSTDFYLGTIRANSQVAYRVVFGRTDANENLVLGAPSQVFTVINPLFFPTAVVRGADDSGGAGFATVTVTVSNNLIVNDVIYVYGALTTGQAIDDGTAFTVLTASSTQFTFNVPNATTTINTLNFGYEQTARLAFSIPSEILSTEYVYQIYRTIPADTADYTTIPNGTFQLVTEKNITSQQVTDQIVYYVDTVPNQLLGAELYTNNNTREGELQANFRAPRAKDIAVFRGFTFLANTTQYESLELSVISASNIVNGTTLGVGGVNSYMFRRNASNDDAVANQMVQSTAVRAANVVTVTQVNHGFTTGETIWVFDSNFVNPIPSGSKTVTVIDPNTFTFPDTNGAEPGPGLYIIYEGRTDNAGFFLMKASFSSSVVSTTAAQAIQVTARSIAKAIARNPASVVYAQYTSGLTDAQGKMFLQAKSLTQSAFTVDVNNNLETRNYFFPVLPATSEADEQPNQLAFSKVNEPEAFPVTNTILVGAANKAIQRIHALRDSLIILKEDGAYRLNGDDANNFTIILIDVTVFLKATRSSAVLNNEVYGLTNQGVMTINEQQALPISRDIEPLIMSVMANPELENATAGLSYETDRFYVLSTLRPNSTGEVADVVYVYNYLTRSWTRWDTFFYNGKVITSSDKIYYTNNERNSIKIERKDATKIDYSDQEYGVPVYKGYIADIESEVGSDEVTVTTLIEHGLGVGDIVTVAEVGTLISVSFSGGSADLTGLRVVTSVPTLTSFTFDASTVATATTPDFIKYQNWISELYTQADATVGSNIITVTTTVPHQLNNMQLIQILKNTMTTAFPAENTVIGLKSVTVLNATQFTFNATVVALANETATVQITDQRQTYYYNNITSTPLVVPGEGDALVYDGILYKIFEIIRYSSTEYLAKLNFQALFTSAQAVLLYSGYTSRIKFSPIFMGDTARLKLITLFQAQFRRDGNCTHLDIDYACDSKNSTGVVEWNNVVGSDGQATTFGGWGEILWGDDPWGEGEAITINYNTSASVQMRTYVNLEAALCTFLQPILVHIFAGEQINLQSISFDSNIISSNTSR